MSVVGSPESSRRTSWWDDVISVAYDVSRIYELTTGPWREVLDDPGSIGLSAALTPRQAWLTMPTFRARLLKDSLGRAIRDIDYSVYLFRLDDGYLVLPDGTYVFPSSDPLTSAGAPLINLTTATTNLVFIATLDAALLESAPDDDSGSDDTSTGADSADSDDTSTGADSTDSDDTSTGADSTGSTSDSKEEPLVSTDLENVIEETPTLCGDTNVEVEEMPSCIRDPAAPVQDWSTTDQVFLNPNNCQYYVPVDTEFECPGAEALESRIFSRIGRSTDALLDYLNIGGLDDDPDAPIKAQVLAEYIRTRGSIAYEYEKFPRRNLRALYKYPFYLVSALGLVESSGENTSAPPSNQSVIIPTKDLLRNISRLRRALRKLAYRQIRAIGDDRFTLVIGGSDIQVNLIEEVELVQALRSELNELLKDNNFILPNAANRVRASRSQIRLPNEKIIANEILISIDQNYRMSTMFAKPIDTGFRRLNISSINPASIFNNPTMVFYLANLPQIIDVIETPQGLTIDSLISSFHYPVITKSTFEGRQNNFQDCDVPAEMANQLKEMALTSLSDAANRALQNLALGIEQNVCMDGQQVIDRNQKLADSLENLRTQLQQQSRQTVQSAGLINDVITMIEQVRSGSVDASQLVAIWSNFLNNVTACGIANLSIETIRSILRIDLCGISPEKALQSFLKQIMSDLPSSLEDIWDLLDEGVKSAVEGQYREAISETLAQSGYTEGVPLPWQYAESLEQNREAALRGLNFYNNGIFSTNAEPDALSVAFLQGYNYDFSSYDDGGYSQNEEYSFWLGFVLAATEIIQTGDRLGDPEFERPPFLPQENQRSVVAQVDAEVLNEQFSELVILNTPLGNLINIIKSVPGVGQNLLGVLDALPEATQCIINSNIRDVFGENLDVFQNNLDSLAGEGNPDFCNFRPITAPDISLMVSQDINTLWSAILDAIIDTLIEMIPALILNLTIQMLRIMVSGFQGGLCDAAGGVFDAAVEGTLGEDLARTFDLRSGFQEAFCDEAPSSNTIDDRLADLAARASGLSPEAAAEAVSGSSNLIDELSRRLRPDQLLRLLQGDPTNDILATALRVVQFTGGSLADQLTSQAAVRAFFRDLGASFPPSFLQSLRDAVDFAAIEGSVASTCDIDRISDNFANSLRGECGDLITEEQIEEQLRRYEERSINLVEQMASAMALGIDGASASMVETMIQETLPKDDPANLVIAEEIISMMFDPLFVTYANDLMAVMNPRGNGGFINLLLSNKNAVPQRGQITNFRLAAALEPGAADEASIQAFFGEDGERKPETVAEYLRQIMSNFTTDEGPIRPYINDDLGFTLSFGRNGNSVFNIFYNANAGAVRIEYDFSYLGRQTFTLNQTFNYFDSLESVDPLAQNIYLVSLQYFLDAASLPLRSPSNLGTAVLTAASVASGLEAIAPLGASGFSEYNSLRLRMRDLIVKNITARVSQNSLSFDYGDYLLEPLTLEQLRGAAPPPPGYEILGLPDGRISVVPPPKGGWLQVKDILLGVPDEEFCCDDELLQENIFDIEAIRREVLESYKASVDDPRLSQNPKTVNEPPYARILSRMNTSAVEGIVVTTIKTYIIEYILRGLASFNIYRTNEEVFGPLLSGYVAEKMRQGLRAQRPRPAAPSFPRGAPGEENKLYAYWYEFLEQSCQIVSNRIKQGRLYVNSQELDQALSTIQTRMSEYEYPQIQSLREVRRELNNPTITLKNWRQKSKINFIEETESSAMVVFKYLIQDELGKLAEKINRIFPSGDEENGYISNYSDLMESLFLSVGDQNIFDIPQYSPADDVVGAVLPSIREGSITEQLRDQLRSGQFILETYVRATPSIEYSTALDSISPIFGLGGVMGIAEFANLIRELGPDEALTPISNIFDDLKYGLRLTYLLSADDVESNPAIVGEMNSFVDAQNRFFEHEIFEDVVGGARYTIPIVYNSSTLEEEYELTSQSMRDFANAVGTGAYSSNIRDTEGSLRGRIFNWQSLWQRMLNTGEFRLLFDYSLQTRNILSLMSIYNIESFLDCIGGEEDEWNTEAPRPINNFYRWNQEAFVRLRRQLKLMFKEVYNAQDFTYREEGLGAAEQREVTRIREETDVNTTIPDDLPPGFANRVISSSVVCPEPEEEPATPEPPTDSTEDSDDDDSDPGAPELPGIEGGLPTKPGSELLDKDFREAAARKLASTSELATWVDSVVTSYATDEDFQELLADLNNAFLGGFGLPKNFNLDDLIAGAGGAWDRTLFESLGKDIDSTLAENYSRVTSLVGEMTGKEIDDFISANFHTPAEQTAARSAIDTLLTDDISVPSDFITTFFS